MAISNYEYTIKGVCHWALQNPRLYKEWKKSSSKGDKSVNIVKSLEGITLSTFTYCVIK